MKKRIISILLCMLMLVTSAVSFIGCGDDTKKIFTEGKASAMTITITTIYDDYDPSNEDQVEALKMVQDALNEITEVKFNTHVVIQPMKSEDYMNQILDMSAKINAEVKAEDLALEELVKTKKANKQGSQLTKNEIMAEVAKRTYTSKYSVLGSDYLTAANNDSVYVDALGRYQTMYPSVDKEGNYAESGKQLDIVLINSAEMYNRMVDLGYLYYITSDFLSDNTTSNQLIQKFVNSTAYNYVDIDSGMGLNELYAIPNNTVYGEYSYILVNRELFDEYKYDINYDYNSIGASSTGVDDFSDLENFIMDVANDSTKSDYRPILNNPGIEFLSPFGENSVLVTDATSKYSTDVAPSPKVITNSLVYRSYFRTMYTLTQTGTYAQSRMPITTEMLTESDLLTTYKDEKFGVAFATGNLSMIEKFAGTEEEPGDYYVVVTHAPYVDDNVYESMYAISACIGADPFSEKTRATRCYQILELFSTNTEWVNLLTYGVEGEHYEFSSFDEDLVVNRSSDYTFNRRYAGNMFLQYVSEDMDPELKAYAENGWELARRQNLNAVVSPYAGFTFKTMSGGEEDTPVMMKLPASENELPVSTVLKQWEATDAKYAALLANYDHYEQYIAENPGTSFDDYFKAFTLLVQKETVYAYLTDASSNAPQTQFNLFYLNKNAD